MDKGIQELFNTLGGAFSDTLPQILGGAIELLTLPFRLVLALLA